MNIKDIDKDKLFKDINKLMEIRSQGKLGGEKMPEDSNPDLDKSSKENYLYFTLPMSLNYQRNSYKLWESAKKTYQDDSVNFVFSPKEIIKRDYIEIQNALIKYKIALQKNKQTEIWIKLCTTIEEKLDGDIRNLFKVNDFDICKIKKYIQKDNKKDFPYLSGDKILNYWLYVLSNYADIEFKNLKYLNIAPDTHIIKASKMLGVIDEEEYNSSNVQKIVEERWNILLDETNYIPINLHTPMWLWSRNGFIDLI